MHTFTGYIKSTQQEQSSELYVCVIILFYL
jgi:hypothetical protein